MDLNLLAGPAALALAASVAVIALWRAHVRADDLRDTVLRTLTESVGAFPAALKDLTAIVVASAERERTRPRSERSGDR